MFTGWREFSHLVDATMLSFTARNVLAPEPGAQSGGVGDMNTFRRALTFIAAGLVVATMAPGAVATPIINDDGLNPTSILAGSSSLRLSR